MQTESDILAAATELSTTIPTLSENNDKQNDDPLDDKEKLNATMDTATFELLGSLAGYHGSDSNKVNQI